MDRGAALVITLVIGAGIAAQAPANALLGKHTGAVAAAFTSLVIATTIVFVIMVATGDVGRLADIPGAIRPEHALGGIAGAAVVYLTILTLPPLGAGALAAALVVGQLFAGVALDRFGLLGLPQITFTAGQYLGLLLLIVGTVLVTKP